MMDYARYMTTAPKFARTLIAVRAAIVFARGKAMYDLSVIIPARNEIFLERTVNDLLEHVEGNTEVIVILDGGLPLSPIPDHPNLQMILHSKSIGQRAATNEAARLSQAKWLMKVDAHCSFDQGFDVKMMESMQDDVTLIPVMRNLHAFDWVCPQGHRRYQSPSGVCKECGQETKMDMVWIAKRNPQSTTYRFDKTMHFQYWSEYGKAQTGDLIETLSIQGSCFMVTREKYFELDLCSEEFNSWGQQGVEVACKTWLSGGRVLVTRKTWYAHMFRTQGGDFGFPYEIPQKEIDANRELSRDLFINNKWPKAIHTFQWLIDKFAPPEWDISDGSSEHELISSLEKKLIEMADLLIEYYNPCDLRVGSCRGGDPTLCCTHTPFGSDVCPFLKEHHCTFQNSNCKLWFCESALKSLDPKAVEAFILLQKFAQVYGLMKSPMIGLPYVGADKVKG